MKVHSTESLKTVREYIMNSPQDHTLVVVYGIGQDVRHTIPLEHDEASLTKVIQEVQEICASAVQGQWFLVDTVKRYYQL